MENKTSSTCDCEDISWKSRCPFDGDITLNTKSGPVLAHGVLLSLESTVLCEMLSADQERVGLTIDLTAYDKQIVDAFLRTTEGNPPRFCVNQEHIPFWHKLWMFSHCYGILKLERLCTGVVYPQTDSQPRRVKETQALAERLNQDGLSKVCVGWLFKRRKTFESKTVDEKWVKKVQYQIRMLRRQCKSTTSAFLQRHQNDLIQGTSLRKILFDHPWIAEHICDKNAVRTLLVQPACPTQACNKCVKK